MSNLSSSHRLSHPHFILRSVAGLFAAFLCTTAVAAPVAYVDETEFHNALALLGYTAVHEGFEDDVAWGAVRSSIVDGFHSTPSVSSLGMTWTSNYIAGGITTSEGPVRSGMYGVYSYLHGSYESPDPGTDCSVPGDCGDGWRGTPDSGVFIAMGGYIDTNTPYAKLGMFIGEYPENPVDFGETCDGGGNCSPNSVIGTAKKFFGVIDPDGFSAFEYRELEGKTEPPFGGDLKYIFADDFHFVIALPPAPAVLVSPVGGLATTESGGSATFDVVLSAPPAADVTLALVSSNTGEGVVSPAQLDFTTANWDSAQTATVIGVNDALPDGNQAYTVSVSVGASADPAYAGLAPVEVSVTNVDEAAACCAIVYVDADAPGANDGTSWFDAYNDLQSALSNIGTGEIWVAAGSYKPGATRGETFQLRNNVEIYGGFTGTETVRGQRDPAANITTLDGDLLGNDYYRFVNSHVAWGDAADNSHHIVTGSNTDATAVLDGFVLAHGYARGAGGDPGPSIQGGGGLIIQNGNPTIRNVTIDGSSGWYGGGAYVYDGSPSFSDCEFRDNYGDIGRAGGIYIGGASSVTFSNCHFEGNAAIGTQSPDGLGGGAYIDFGSTANFTGSTFIKNLTGYRTNDQGGSTATKGGAILAGGDVYVRDSWFFANKSHYGGAIYAFNGLTLIDNVFNGNEATSAPTTPSSGGLGGALMLSDVSTLIGNTVTANEGSENAAGIYVTSGGDVLMVNNILWGNTVSKYIPPEEDQIPLSRVQLHNGGGIVDMSYGIFEGLYEEISGEDPPDPTDFPGVLDLDPLFEDDNGLDGITGNEDDDLRPGDGSPAIDSGDNSAVPVDILSDIGGDQRFQDDPATPDTGAGAAPIVDMGPYEIGGTTPANQPPVAVPSASPLSGEAPLSVQFDSTGSDDPDGTIVSYAWIFGDGGSASTAAPAYLYTTAGSYTAYLTVTDDDGDTHSDSVGITVLAPVPNQAPIAQISALPTSGTTPLNVNFDGSTSYDGDGTITSWDWDFGDGGSDSGASSSHVYTTAGSFTVWLTVTDDDGATASEWELVTVADPAPNEAPVAVASASPVSGEMPHSVDFDGLDSFDNDGTIASYDWDFGDGNGGTGGTANHIYTAAGDFTAILTVTDNDGASATDTVPISVSGAPPPATETDHLASGEIAGSGSVNGNFTATHADAEGAVQSITERLSGGKKNRRYSFLEHTWQFNITPGASFTVFANAWSGGSGDSDSFVFEWSTSSTGGFQPLFTVGNDSGAGSKQSAPIDTSGTIYIHVRDLDHNAGNTALDTVYVDHLHIKTVSAAGDPPAAPSGISVTGATSSSLTVNWTDKSTDETSFTVERSTDNSNFSFLATLDANVTSHTDSGLAGNATYWYRAYASNASGSSTASASAPGTTLVGADITLSANGYKIKGKQNVDLSWDGTNADDMDIYRDNMDAPHVTIANGGAHTDKIGAKGGGSYVYKVCEAGTGNCSGTVTVVF